MDLTKIKNIAIGHYATNDHPLFVIDLPRIRKNYRDFKDSFPLTDVHFAVKSLTDAEVIKALSEEGCSFEVASLGELYLLLSVLPKSQLRQVFYSNPVKSRRAIAAALISGIRWMVVDAYAEMLKIIQVAYDLQVPYSELKLYVRVKGLSQHSVWPLSSKFGATINDAMSIIGVAEILELKISGFTFHVGSQCLDYQAWGNSIAELNQLIDHADQLGVATDELLINVGGGFPSNVTSHDATLDKIYTYMMEKMGESKHWARMSLSAEPGRFIVSSGGTLVSRVLLRSVKEDDHWLYIDAGVYHGMIEPSQGVMGKVTSSADSEQSLEFTIAGPSCDSADVLPLTVQLPASVSEGDLLFIENSGAYSLAYATGSADARVPGFNGFFPPSVYYIT